MFKLLLSHVTLIRSYTDAFYPSYNMVISLALHSVKRVDFGGKELVFLKSNAVYNFKLQC